MLEALLFKKEGKLLQFSRDNPKNRDFAPSLWDKKLVDLFEPNNGPRNRPFLEQYPCRQDMVRTDRNHAAHPTRLPGLPVRRLRG
ncbi:hypothetical protein LNP26_28770 [Klebsiella variicola subsp. variicola]|nr:hypothetical protein [Klebsiella variicola subsp. variicola]